MVENAIKQNYGALCEPRPLEHPWTPGLATLASPLARFARSWPKNALKHGLGAFTMHFASFGTLFKKSIFFDFFQDFGTPGLASLAPTPRSAPLVRTTWLASLAKLKNSRLGRKKNLFSKIRNGEVCLFWVLFQMTK